MLLFHRSKDLFLDAYRLIKKFRLLIVILVLSGSASALNYKYILNAPDLLTGFSSRVGCSLHYVSKFTEKEVIADLLNYSSLIDYVDIEFDSNNKSVTSRFLWKEAVSTYKQGTGCTFTAENKRTHLVDGRVDSSVSPPLNVNLSPILNESLKTLLEQDNISGWDTRAVVILQNGALVAEQYSGAYSDSTQFLGWSIAKTLNSIIIGNMVKNGLINFNEANLFTVSDDDPRISITIESLLTMTSGQVFDEDSSPGGGAVKMLFSDYAAYKRPLASDVAYEAGTNFSYSSGSSNILTHLAYSKFTNHQKAYSYIQEQVLSPLGMNETVIENDPSGVFVGSSFIYATAQDYAKLGQIFLDKGVALNGAQVVDPDWIERAVQPNNSKNENAYGYHVWLNSGNKNGLRWPSLPKGTFAAKGNKGQFIIIIPELDVVVVRLGWSKGDYPIELFVSVILREITL